MRNPFRYFNSSPEVIRLTVMMYIRYPLSLRQVEDILFERGIDFGLPPFFVPVAMLVLARFQGRAEPAVAHP